MYSSILITEEELEKGYVNTHNEITLRPGKSFSVPIKIRKVNTVLGWEFSSQPKVGLKCDALFYEKQGILGIGPVCLSVHEHISATIDEIGSILHTVILKENPIGMQIPSL